MRHDLTEKHELAGDQFAFPRKREEPARRP